MSTKCDRCAGSVLEGSRFCPSCGAAMAVNGPGADASTGAGADATETSLGSTAAVPSSDPSAPSGGRFIPGTVLLDRYRVVGLLGRGGMGEVYRAEDLKLGQSVALKWLPRGLEHDPSRLQRLLSEVRLSLKVTHPNVCRVFDIGESGDAHFLSMEYVDGEDLASLLRRIGRLPGDKAVQVARQLCAGLAAAHDEGVLHRDLKPANVMIDGRGRAKITDFGLAGAVEGIEGAEARAGTPGYMAPEQLAGGKLGPRTDVYALGLVLYELFTGKRAFRAESIAELRERQSSTLPSSPSSHVDGIDPLVERVILRCLSPDPADRPDSARAVAAALPGGDPLAAAIAAGETPSPDMVAAAGGRGGLRAPVAWALVAVAVVGIVAGLFVHAPKNPLEHRGPEKPLEVLTDKARELLDELGVRNPDAAHAASFVEGPGSLEWARERIGEPDWYADLPDDLPWARFWYRERDGRLGSDRSYGYTLNDDPPLIVPGEVLVELDLDGRLLALERVPGTEATIGEGEPLDWAPVFRAAELDPATLRPVAPRRVPAHYADRRFAWEGPSPRAGDFGEPIRVEAASLGSRPVMFRVENPWGDETVGAAADPPAMFTVLFVVALITAAVHARKNVRTGRADTRTANVLAAIYVGLHTVTILPVLTLSTEPASLNVQVRQMLAEAGLQAATLWLAYLGLEPIVRRRWPSVLVAWSRLLQGGVLDPLVGRNILAGCAVGAVCGVALGVPFWIARWVDAAPPVPLLPPGFGLAPHPFLWTVHISLHLVEITMLFLLAFVLLSVVGRNAWVTVGVILGGMALMQILGGVPPASVAVSVFVAAGIFTVLLRVGYLAAAVACCVAALGGFGPSSLALGEWYGTPTVIRLVTFGVLLTYGFWVSLAGKPMFGGAERE